MVNATTPDGFGMAGWADWLIEYETELKRSVGQRNPLKTGEKAAEKVGLKNWSQYEECYNSKSGDDAINLMYHLTANLQPPHKFTPWLTRNGKHTDAQQKICQEDFVKCACEVYDGQSDLCHRQRAGNQTATFHSI